MTILHETVDAKGLVLCPLKEDSSLSPLHLSPSRWQMEMLRCRDSLIPSTTTTDPQHVTDVVLGPMHGD